MQSRYECNKQLLYPLLLRMPCVLPVFPTINGPAADHSYDQPQKTLPSQQISSEYLIYEKSVS